MDVLNTLRSAVREYEENWRHPDLPKFQISEPVYDIQQDFDRQYPFAESWGCYVFFGENYELSYIGKASGLSTSLGWRIGSYFRQPERRKPLVPQYSWNIVLRYIVSVAVHKAFEAPSLEEFLILKLNPSDNVRGKRPPA